VKASIVVNDRAQEIPAGGGTLLSFLREELELTGAKPGCGEGACGACTVLVDGEAVRACTTDVNDVAGRSVVTIEGLSRGGMLHPVARAFLEIGAMQCGYCTPGMVITAAALLARIPAPAEAEIKTAMAGNVCRCCAYPRILRAVTRAAELLRDGDASATSVAEDPAPADLRAATGTPWDLLEPEARGYFDVLGDGLVVVLPPGQTSRGRPRPSWPGSMNGGAWIHVGAQGIVTAFTGKVDMGQDNRTTLTLLVAEELRAPLATVRLLMGDTAVSPFDIGTFGSRSVIDAGEDLRLTAASTRDHLVLLAADGWDRDPAELEAADARVRERRGDLSSTYGELVAGMRRVETATADEAVTAATAWHTAGQPVRRVQATGAVTGARRYASDLTLPDMLHGIVLRPPALGVRLRSVDPTGARSMAGVTVVHEGSFVAVTAPRRTTALEALRRIRAEWDVEPQVAESDLIDHLRGHPVEAHGWETAMHHEAGDVDLALATAAVRLDATYTTAYVAHAPLETRAALAAWDEGHVTVWVGTQQPFGVRRELAAALGLDEASVRVIVPPIGGAFGGKQSADVAIEAARLARATERPVHIRWSREEEFHAHLRPAAVIDVRSGVDSVGVITAWDFHNLNSGTQSILCPYEIANQRIEFQPADSPLPQGPYRSLAATANTFARESHMDELARRLGADPLAFRLRHLSDERLADVLHAAAGHGGWSAESPRDGEGVGIACGLEKGGYVATCVAVHVDGDGCPEITRIVTAFECGAIVNPDGLGNQVEGATIMGLGGALFESVHFDGGRMLNASFSQYRVPRFTDFPPVDVVLLDRRDLPSAGGGEAPIIAVAPALANALFAATGRRLRALPLLTDGRVR
jgi:nicotinate dehydrogenase subunit B